MIPLIVSTVTHLDHVLVYSRKGVLLAVWQPLDGIEEASEELIVGFPCFIFSGRAVLACMVVGRAIGFLKDLKFGNMKW